MTNLYYLPELNLHLDTVTGEVYTDDQIEAFSKMEQVWRESQRVPSFFQLIDTFGPECYQVAARAITLTIDQAKNEIKTIKTDINNFYLTVVNPAHYEKQKGLTETMHGLYDHHLNNAEHAIHRGKYRLGYLRRLRTRYLATKHGTALPPEDPNHITEVDIVRAKEIPIESLYTGKLRKIGNRLTGICNFHQDKDPSLVIYLKSNTWHCFSGCSGNDSIDYIQREQQVDFLSAVKILLNRT